MTGRLLTPVPLTAERFARFGEVISVGDGAEPMNEARFERFGELADVDVDGKAAIGIVRSKAPTALPYRFDLLERHPRGSQAFVPLARFSFLVVVGPPGEVVSGSDLEAFVTNGRQGISYHRGTWHMPLIALEAGQEFLVVDRAPGSGNLEERILEEAVTLGAP